MVGDQPVASGGSGDVYEGWLDDSKVCVKRVRIYSKDGPENVTKVGRRPITLLSTVAEDARRPSTKRP